MGCDTDLELILEAVRGLGDRLGPLLLQPPYLKASAIPSFSAFLGHLEPFLTLLPSDVRFALEIRNRSWMQPDFFSPLRGHRVALAWIDHPYTPGPRPMARLPGAVTTDFLYVPWLRDRHPG